jgi:UDP-2-acetamido-2,6-beta-L-arabino-hexul-4-ose reductase
MLKVGITGQKGFIGQHLYNALGLYPDEFSRVNFDRTYFDNESDLVRFAEQCDVIVHLAAMNRSKSQEVLFKNNIELNTKLIRAIELSKSKVKVIFSSSSQEEKDNLYGQSKKMGRELMSDWAEKSGGKFTGMIIPNVFGPFGKPFYNSFIATFCHKLNCGEDPVVDVDGSVKLIYVGELVNEILKEVRNQESNYSSQIAHTAEYKVTDVLQKLVAYRDQYKEKGIIPLLSDKFEINLFNTFRSYMNIEGHYPVKYIQNTDDRGAFVEVIRLNVGGQVSFSTTVPGIIRGNHFHTRKIERFAVIKGHALIQLRKIGTEKVLNFYLSGDEPAYVDMPVWYTHNIKNIGREELYTIFWINEFYDPNDPDTYFEGV